MSCVPQLKAGRLRPVLFYPYFPIAANGAGLGADVEELFVF